MRSIIARAAAALLAALLAAAPVHANTIRFEGIAPDGGLRNVRPGKPLHADGYMFTSRTGESAVFAADSFYSMIGDPTAIFGFAGGETITLSDPNGAFDLVRLLLGPSNIGSGTTDITLTGYTEFSTIVDRKTFYDLTTATLETLRWTDLSYLTITATTDSSFDDVVVRHPQVSAFAPLPEPDSVALLLSGALAVWGARKKALLF